MLPMLLRVNFIGIVRENVCACVKFILRVNFIDRAREKVCACVKFILRVNFIGSAREKVCACVKFIATREINYTGIARSSDPSGPPYKMTHSPQAFGARTDSETYTFLHFWCICF